MIRPSPGRRLALAGLAAVAISLANSPFASADDRPDLLLVTLDTTRADHLGAWGWPHAMTPHLDALAASGVRFARCDSAAPVTLPSHATLFTGLYPPRHGVRDNGTFVLGSGPATLAERLREGGYDTAAVVSAVVLHRRHGLDRGFRLYDDDLGAGYAQGTEVAERTADATVAAALGTVGKLARPYFLWVHFYDPHEEYRPPSAIADRMQGPARLYDGEIAFVDQQLGRLLAALPRPPVTLVVGDHGEMLGEHGEASHGVLPLAGARRVPLLVAGPGVPGGRVIDDLVRTADVMPTLLSLAGLAPPAGLDGESLTPRFTAAAAAPTFAYSESFLPYFAYKWFPLRTLSDGRVLFLEAPRPALFRLDDDPAETRDLAAVEPALAELWRARLERLLAGAGESLSEVAAPETTLGEEQRRQLAALGYLGGGGGGAVSAALPDPRDRIGIARELHRAAAEIQRGACPTVLRELQRIVGEDPHNFPALTLAGQCLRDAGRHAEALALFARAARENPASAVPVANVAGCLLRLGRSAEAEREFRHALALDPSEGDSVTHLARLLRERGDTVGALELLDRGVASGALQPQVFLERGTARAESGALAAALDDFREAARRAPGDPVALENAARAAFLLGRRREAAETYETLLRAAPQRVDLWKTLAAVYLELDEPLAAERAAREALRREPDPQERARLEELLAGLAP